MTRNSNIHRRLHVERLEQRELLCSSTSTLGSSALQSVAQSALFAKAHTASTVTDGLSKANSSSGGSSESTDTFLVTMLTNSSGEVIGTATFETDVNGSTTKESLVISVVGAAASASYTATAGGTDVGTLTTDANGSGRLVLTSSSSSSTTTSSAAVSANCSGGGNTTTGTLPSGFTLAAGAAINLASSDTTVDPLNGTFATSTGPIGEGNGSGGDHDGCNGNGNSSSVSRTTAALTDSSTSASAGKAVFTTITHTDGTDVEILRVHVTGTDASTTFDVSVDGTSVGTLTTDANGNGYLILSSDPKTSNVGQLPSGITSPTAITLTSTTTSTTINGTFSSSSSSSTSSLASFGRSFSRRR